MEMLSQGFLFLKNLGWEMFDAHLKGTRSFVEKKSSGTRVPTLVSTGCRLRECWPDALDLIFYTHSHVQYRRWHSSFSLSLFRSLFLFLRLKNKKKREKVVPNPQIAPFKQTS
jgi:hypothetical protein